ncbi:ABC transporter ATP-binding protein [Propioniciclava sp. MC1595]|uniref:ABC transporter ATP-binding protein n=1 Tax=Propioniciclava sp. MC1595 TaxID=2760308 RepID=UPI00166229A2|nr:ABC transporter ATP-binding protein [Propioniciclava sp. MC1595]MBB1493594.1 ABC transporter ATP-binding protein [Propioniciclava sp. MC1595]QTE26984.1 ABC transporter ATP-binding protein [Propioniciclava sp. MC1595]
MSTASTNPATTAAPARKRRTAAGDVVLEVKDLHVTFPSEAGPVRAVRGLSFDLRAGETMAIVGESGSGKSVTSLAIMGLLAKGARVEGSIKLHGDELLGRSDEEMSRTRGQALSMVFQDPLSALTPVYTIGDQIVEAIQIHNKGTSKEAAWQRAIELLDLVGIPNPEQRVKSFPFEFSGGMRQRAMIAMAIANDPDVIIADEPTTALDVTIQAQVLEVLKKAQQETGAAIIMITHDLGVVAGMSDRVTVMYAGRPVEQGTVDDIFYRPAMPYTIGLLGSVPRLDQGNQEALATLEGNPPSVVNLPPGCPFAPRCPLAIEACRTAEPDLERVDSGHAAACVRVDEVVSQGMTYADIFPVPDLTRSQLAEVPREERETVLELNDMKKHYPLMKGAIYRRRVGTVFAVDGIDLDVREGETLGLVGESGCGKSTTLLEVLNLAAPTGGSIEVFGKDTSKLDRKEKFTMRRDLQVVFQDPMASLDPRMPIFDIIAEPLGVHGFSKDEIEKRVMELLKLVGLEEGHADRYPQHFSGGQRQRIGIARALALSPRLIVLDEPVSALDVSIQAGVINLLEDLQGQLGLSYVFVAHDLAVIRHIADRVAVMYLGKIVEIGDVDEVYERPRHPYTQALLSAIPIPDPKTERSRKRILLTGDLPSPADPPSGCKFRTRCQKFPLLSEGEQRKCIEEPPELIGKVPGEDHADACHYSEVVSVM